MIFIDHPPVLFIALFVVLAACVEVGVRLARRGSGHLPDDLHQELGRIRDEFAVLLSVLLGFTLAMVVSRYDLRKQLVVNEADAIGTTGLRAEMLPGPASDKAQDLLRQYANARLNFSKAGLSREKTQAALTRAKQIQMELWQESVMIAEQRPTPITGLFVQSLNEMIDLDDQRRAAIENRLPGAIWLMLVVLSFLTCLLVGYSQRRRMLLTILVTPLMISLVMALVADLDTPGSGLIRVGQQSLQRVKADLNENSPTR